MCLRLCRFYPEDPSLADLAAGDPGIVPICIFVVLYRLLSGNVRVFACQSFFSFFFSGGGGRRWEEAKAVQQRKKRKEKEGRDGWGQFGGPGCFNYPALCRWVRAHYLSLALSLSHDLSSTFIPKPSAPLAKQRKKGGQRRAFTAVTMPHLPLISPHLLFLM